jgi:hypothetical protein
MYKKNKQRNTKLCTKKRRDSDFSKHKLEIKKTELMIMHKLFLPEQPNCENVEFYNIKDNARGILVVNGAWDKHIFDRAFIPVSGGKVSDLYWAEKCKTKPEYNADETYDNIQNYIKTLRKENRGVDIKEDIAFLKEFLKETEDEFIANSFLETTRYDDFLEPYELLAYSKSFLNPIFDAFEEICRRLPECKTDFEETK